MGGKWQWRELQFLVLHAVFIIRRSLQLSRGAWSLVIPGLDKDNSGCRDVKKLHDLLLQWFDDAKKKASHQYERWQWKSCKKSQKGERCKCGLKKTFSRRLNYSCVELGLEVQVLKVRFYRCLRAPSSDGGNNNTCSCKLAV